MPRTRAFSAVEAIGRRLPDVDVVTMYGQPALKVQGRLLACMASNKSAEPNSLVVAMDFTDRDALLQDDPETYYIKDHYAPYPCVVVRLSRIRLDALRDLLVGAHRYVSARASRKPRRATTRRTMRTKRRSRH
jgi:hypothetical protein